MKPKDEFVRRWKHHVAGIIGLGSGRVKKLLTGQIESAQAFGETMTELGTTAETLLNQIYDYLSEAPKTAVGENGTPAVEPKKVPATQTQGVKK